MIQERLIASLEEDRDKGKKRRVEKVFKKTELCFPVFLASALNSGSAIFPESLPGMFTYLGFGVHACSPLCFDLYIGTYSPP